MKILIVDDEAVVIDSCRRILALEGHETVVAGNVEEGRRHLASGSAFDMILTDIKMPGADGFQLIAEAKRLRPGVAVIVMTGFLTPETAARAEEEGGGRLYRQAVYPGRVEQDPSGDPRRESMIAQSGPISTGGGDSFPG